MRVLVLSLCIAILAVAIVATAFVLWLFNFAKDMSLEERVHFRRFIKKYYHNSVFLYWLKEVVFRNKD